MPAITSSELTKLNQEKTIYADIFTQQQLYAQGLIPAIRYSNTSRLDNHVTLTGFVGGGVQLNSTAPTANKSNAGDLAKILTVVTQLKSKFSKSPTLTSISFGVLTAYSANLTSRWEITISSAVTVRYYLSLTSSSVGKVLVGTQNEASGILADTLANYTPEAGNYYFVGITPSGSTESLSSAMFMPFPAPTGVLINDLTYVSGSLGASWIQIPAAAVTVVYYLTNSVYPSGGVQVGTSQSVASGTLNNTLSGYTPVAGSFYYVGVTPSGGSETLSPIATQMPYPLVSSVSLNTLTASSTGLASCWALIPSAALVTVRYYATNSSAASAGTQVGVTQNPATGVFTNTLGGFTPVAGTYYYVGVTGPSGTEVTSTLAIQLPYPVASGVTLGSLGNSSTSLNASWSVTPASALTVRYYSNSTNSTTGGTLVASQSIATGILIASYSYTPVPGTYYYVGVTPTDSSEQLSAAATQMPYAVASGVVLNALAASSTTLGGSWTVVNASAVTVKYYSTNSTSVPAGAKTQVGSSQLVASGTTTNTMPSATYTPVNGTYYFLGVKPTGGSEVFSSVATLKNAAVASAVALGALSDSSTALAGTWAISAPSAVTVKYYSTNSTTASGGVQVGTSQAVASGTVANTMSAFAPVPGTYYYVGVTPTAGVEVLSSVATLMPAAVASNVTLGSLTASSAQLQSAWALTSSQQVSVQYYYNATNSNTVSGATAVGSAQTVAAGTTILSLTVALVAGKYYFVGVTPTGGSQVVSSTTLMPSPQVAGVSLGGLNNTSASLSSSWTVTPAADVSVQYYSTNSSTVPASGGTTVGSAQTVASGTSTNTLSTSLTAGLYYYVGVVPSAGGVEVRSTAAIQMPYATAAAVVLGALDPGATGFTVNWLVSSNSAVTVKFYSTTSNSIPASKTLVGTAQTVASGITTLTVSWSTLTYTAVNGTYYFVGVTPSGGSESFSSSAAQFPYATAATVQLTGLTHSSTNLSSSWGVSPASLVTVKYYQYRNDDDDSTVVGTASVGSATTTHTLSYNPTVGYSYRVGVTPAGGSQTLSAKVLKSTNFTSLVLNSISNSSTSLSGTWSADTAMAQTIYFYKNATNSTTGGTLINRGGTAVSKQNASVSYTYTPESGYYYYMGVSATGATEIITSGTQYLATTTVTSASMSALTNSSSNIQVSWVVAHRTQVTVVFYTSASSATTSTGTFETQVIEAGITTATSVNAPVRGTYYFVSVTARGGASVATSAAALQMPILNATGVTLNTLSSTSTTLGSSWSVAVPIDVTVKYYTTNSTTVPSSGRVQLGGSSSYSVSAQTTTHSLSGFPPVGPTYYYVGVTASGGTETFSATATLMPGSGVYESNLAIYLNAIDSSHFGSSIWYDPASGQSISMNSLAFNAASLGAVAIGKAVKLLGSASNYGTKTNTSVPFDITGGFSYEMWFYYKVASVGSIAQSIIFESGYSNTNGVFMNGAGNVTIWSANVDGGRTDTNVGTYTKTSSYSTAGQAFQIPINQWIHLVTTVSSTATRLYINTELVAEQTHSTAITQQGATNSIILGDANISESYVGRARVYTIPLTASQVKSNYNADSTYFGLSSK